MNFFTVGTDEKPKGHLQSSLDIWIYFVIAIPLTLIVLGVWKFCQKMEAKRAKQRTQIGTYGDVEKGGKEQ